MEVEDWSRDLMEWCADAQKELLTQASVAVRTVCHSIVNNSPHFATGSRYSTGQFVGNWQLGPNPASVPKLGVRATKEAKNQEIDRIMSEDYFFLYKDAYFVNCLDYVDKVEYRGWMITGPYQPVAKGTAGFAGEAPVTRAIAENSI